MCFFVLDDSPLFLLGALAFMDISIGHLDNSGNILFYKKAVQPSVHKMNRRNIYGF